MPNPYLIFGATGAARAITNGLGGQRRKKKHNQMIDSEINRLNSIIGKPVYDVAGVDAYAVRAAAHEAGRQGNRYDKIMNFDAGQTAGRLMEGNIGNRYQNLANLKLDEATKRSTRDTAYQNRISELNMNRDNNDYTWSTIGGVAGAAGDAYSKYLFDKKAQTELEKERQHQINMQPRIGQPPNTMDQSEYSHTLPQAQPGGYAPGEQGIVGRPSYDYDNAGGFNMQTPQGQQEVFGSNQTQQTSFKKPEDVLAHAYNTGQISFEEWVSRLQGLNSKNKTEWKKPSPSTSSSDLDKIINERTKVIFGQHGITGGDYGSNMSQLQGKTGAEDAVKQIEYYNDPANRLEMVNDSLPKWMPEKYTEQGNWNQTGFRPQYPQQNIPEVPANFGVGQPPPNDGTLTPEQYQELLNLWFSYGYQKALTTQKVF